jgi:GT2 family glycosyltransferase
MNEQDTLIGIVTLNRLKKLMKTLDECSKRGFHNIVVVDNGSTDGTRDFLLEQSELSTIFTERNEGGSGGFNRIMHHFIEKTEHRWLLLFDDDAYPSFSADTLSNFLARDNDANRPAYAFKVVYPDGTLCEMNRPGLNILDKNPFKIRRRDFHIQESTEACLMDFASFVGILLKRKTVLQNGCVSKEFFIYSDDTYYSLSISSRIGKICYRPEFVLIHDCNRSSRNMANHDRARLRKDVVNKMVLIREYSKFKKLYLFLYVARLILRNPKRSIEILRALYVGISTNLQPYRNEKPSAWAKQL